MNKTVVLLIVLLLLVCFGASIGMGFANDNSAERPQEPQSDTIPVDEPWAVRLRGRLTKKVKPEEIVAAEGAGGCSFDGQRFMAPVDGECVFTIDKTEDAVRKFELTAGERCVRGLLAQDDERTQRHTVCATAVSYEIFENNNATLTLSDCPPVPQESSNENDEEQEPPPQPACTLTLGN